MVDDSDVLKFLLNNLQIARDNNAILDRFGRYPKRNKILGRESTPEEKAYLTGYRNEKSGIKLSAIPELSEIKYNQTLKARNSVPKQRPQP